MTPAVMKYNPAFLTDEELTQAFVVRQTELDLILERVSENTGPANQHVLVVGPRGSGKTMLLHRVGAAVRADEGLRRQWYVIAFAEETNEVFSPGQFWLEALRHLGEATQTTEPRWLEAHQDLFDNERDDARLRERALAQLTDFADEHGQRLLLLAENLNDLFGEGISEDDAWIIRDTLLHEPRIMLLGSATTQNEALVNEGKAMFELFYTLKLEPLDNHDCRVLWQHLTGQELNRMQIRPIQILTGASPRLIAMISTFDVAKSFREFMDDLLYLLDDHTNYFRSCIEALPPLERRVFLALATIWDQATAREVAHVARTDVNKASGQLLRLVNRGVVSVTDEKPRLKRYQVAERLLNIYHLMRRSQQPHSRVRAFVDFMVHFYARDAIVDRTAAIAREACSLDPERREYHYEMYCALLDSLPTEYDRYDILSHTPPEFFTQKDAPQELKRRFDGFLERQSGDTELDKLLVKGLDLLEEQKAPKQAEEVLRRAIAMQAQNGWPKACLAYALIMQGRGDEAAAEATRAVKLQPEDARVWAALGQVHELSGAPDEAEQAYRKVVQLAPEAAAGSALMARLLHKRLNRFEEAEQAYRKAIELEPKLAWTWAHLGQLLHEELGRHHEAEQAYRKALRLAPEDAPRWAQLGQLLHEELSRHDEAEQAYRKAIEIDEQYAWAWVQLGQLLHEELGRHEEAEQAYRKAIEIDEQYAWAWVQLGRLLDEELGRHDEAEQAYREAIEIDKQYALAWARLGQLLHEQLGRHDEAEQAYRKAIEIEPDVAWGWAKLGELLHEDLGRPQEAEAAYRKAIEIDEEFAWAWAGLGKLLHERLGRADEAEQAYRKAIEIQPDVAWGWAKLGQLLHEELGRHDEAEQAYRKAVEIDDKNAWAWAELGQLLHEELGRPKEAEGAYRKAAELLPSLPDPWRGLLVLASQGVATYDSVRELADECVRGSEDSPDTPNNIAYVFFVHGRRELLTAAEAWSRRAHEMAPDSPVYRTTLAGILAALGRADEALEHVSGILADPDFVGRAADEVVDLFVALAALGRVRESLHTLRRSPATGQLEPVEVALRMCLGEDVNVAQEIAEVAKDIVAKIEDHRSELECQAQED